MTVITTKQMTLDFQPGLAERHQSLLACVRAGAYSHSNPLKTIAADMDMSQSTLSRKLGGDPDDPRKFSVDDLEKYLVATGDLTPVYFLIEKYLQDEKAKQDRALQELAKRLPDVLALIKQVSAGGAA
ncbi:hypothetical protein OYT13_15905 [Pandoraea sp. XJJ-1]|uniref:Uncharacterized protein n=1 Tax=Pandoraea eparura TaxID=2508291 RepID=A0A5E4X4T0_9BURK|nr:MULTISPECIES: phage regulatory CII family protein [Pandoraea]WAL81336.1 hypothetical protein OYT13_15905 [Pandoraea sp. XJJ-1]VVE31238.1 hypothetical protein PEP31012_03687 [Pandoraea eparura]